MLPQLNSPTIWCHSMQKHLQPMDKGPSDCDMNNIYGPASNKFNSASTPVDSQICDNSRGIDHSLNHSSHGHDINSCTFQARVWAERARSMDKEKEESLQACIGKQNMILEEIKKRDEVIQFLKRDIEQEKLRSRKEVYRLEHELYIMRELLMGYRMQMKDVNRKFSEYRARQAHPINLSDINAEGSGGLVLDVHQSKLEPIRSIIR